VRACIYRLVLISWVVLWSWSLPTDEIAIVVVAGRAGVRSPDEAALLERLKQARQEPGFQGLRLFTLHYDQPAEAAYCRKYLGVQTVDLPTVALVRVNPRNGAPRPERGIYRFGPVGTYSIEKATRGALERWGSLTGRQVSFAPAVSSPPPAAKGPDRILGGAGLQPGERLESPNQRYRFCCQHDGNCVLYRVVNQVLEPMWQTDTRGEGCSLTLSESGRLRLTDRLGDVLWQTDSLEQPGQHYLQVQDDGNLVLYHRAGATFVAIWATRTHER